MLPPTQYIQNHVYFTFVLFLTSYDSAYKKHTKDLSYAKPYYHTILPFIRKGVHFLMSFLLPSFCCARIFQTWDSLLCTEFTRNVLTLLIMQICLHSIPPPPPVLYKKKKNVFLKTRLSQVVFFSKNQKHSLLYMPWLTELVTPFWSLQMFILCKIIKYKPARCVKTSPGLSKTRTHPKYRITQLEEVLQNRMIYNI